ncbi:hypothetical protein EFR84_26940 [Rhizobium chutanense]|uniref:Uncharacterized protein n=1 Tax=Rhizobium chutanense TaxID=2035448 RepID=A0A3S0SSS7_9HYPH|nr:hypothetical protein EFR84_26940 [Rhizobium chutanense]
MPFACRSRRSSLTLLTPLICPDGHLLPAGEKGEQGAATSPFSPAGRRCRQADEGATRHTLHCLASLSASEGT